MENKTILNLFKEIRKIKPTVAYITLVSNKGVQLLDINFNRIEIDINTNLSVFTDTIDNMELNKIYYYYDILKDDTIDKVVNLLKELDVDGETMEYIINKVGMRTQMENQLVFNELEFRLTNKEITSISDVKVLNQFLTDKGQNTIKI